MQTENAVQAVAEAHEPEPHALVPYGVYWKVWAVLIALTAVTVAVSYVDMRHVTVLTATLIATVKATLVLLYFMHIRFEQRLFAIMVVAILLTYAVFIGLTFLDYGFR